MDLNDSFAEKILHNIKNKRSVLNEKKMEVVQPGKKRATFEEHSDNADVPPEESPKRQCTGVLQTTSSWHNKENIEMMDDTTSDFVPFSASKTRGLAALRKKFSNDDEEDGFTKASAQQVNKCDKFLFSTNSSDLCAQPKQKSRLADLAANIRQWEDAIHTPTLSSKNVTSATNTTNLPAPLTNTPKSTDKAFSMKVYYTSKQPSDSNNIEKHGVNNSQGIISTFSSPGKRTFDSPLACKKSNIEVGSVKGKYGKLQAWDQAVTSTLETPVFSNSPKKSTAEIARENTQQNTNLDQDSYSEDHSDNSESIDEDDFAEKYDVIANDGADKMEFDSSPTEDVKLPEKSNQPKKFEAFTKPKSPTSGETVKTNVDPAELPLSARKALFENAFMNGTPKINDDRLDPVKLSVAQRAAMFENASKNKAGAKTTHFQEPKRMAFSNFEKFENRNADVHKSPVKFIQPSVKNVQEIRISPRKTPLQLASPVKAPLQLASPVKTPLHVASPVKTPLQTSSPVKKTVSDSVSLTPSPTKNVGSHTRLIQQKLLESTGSNWQEKQAAKAAEERKQEISSLVNHWEKLSSSSSTETNSEVEKAPLACEENFPSKSDAICEATESEAESELRDSEDEDLNTDEMKNDLESELSENEQNDAYSVDEKVEIESEDFYPEETETESVASVEENPVRHFSDVSDNNTKSFTSSCYSGVSSVASDSHYQASKSQSCSSGNSVRSSGFTSSKCEEVFLENSQKKENKNPEINLLRTVSAYRREKQEIKLTPIRTVVRREKVSSPESPPDADFTEVIQQRLKELQDEVLRQQIVISQTSQALNLCSASAEFSGSTEQVEGERLLLIATQKRQACLNEITRLKTCGAQGEIIEGTGTLTITDLQLPLKREFIASQVEGRGTDTVHYFLCLIRHGAQVIVTQMMSTDEKNSDGTLSFTNHIQLRNLSADFSVVFEVYALQAKKEVLPHEKKYHIKRENSKRRLTPKGKKNDNKMPAVCSPGGPNAVRSPSFGVVGFTRFNIQNCNKKTFTLDKVPFTSPLEGVLRVRIKLHAEHKVTLKGFLTFYEDVGEIGALYRRWCVLDGNNISYWLYPDDEHKKEPLGSIDLKQCVTGTVKLVPTLECARSHTFKLVTVRPQKKGDKNTLISRTVNTLTTTKHLLTADTKDERILWCNKINEALENVRKWDPQALRPVESMNI